MVKLCITAVEGYDRPQPKMTAGLSPQQKDEEIEHLKRQLQVSYVWMQENGLIFIVKAYK